MRTRSSAALAGWRQHVSSVLAIAAASVFALPLPVHGAAPEAVTILRDAYGVPQIVTDGPDALLTGAYADGYAQAEDRLFEMEILRRTATGRLAELLGPDYLAMDEVVRRDGFTLREREQIFGRVETRDQEATQAYRDGVNAFIEKVTLDGSLLPFEFSGVPPEPWEVTDSVAIAILEFLVFGANGGQEVLNADLLLDLLDRFPEAQARGIFDDLFWIDDPAAPTTIAAADGATIDPDQIERFAPAQLDFLRAHAASFRRAAASLRTERGLMGGLGAHRHASNAIVVSPALSASGQPLLLGGPQTGLNSPNLFWEVSLHGGGYDAEGVTGPAGPGVLIGRGRNFAVSITSGILDNVDTFVEVLDPADPHRYLFGGASVPFERRSETFKVAGQPDVTLEVLRSVHGPVFFSDPEGGVAFSRRASFRGREFDSAVELIHMGFARNLTDVRRLVDRVAVSLNLHYADTAGNIAFFHRGTRPLRPLHTDPRLTLDGRGTMEWRGIVSPAAFPSVVNPSQGFIANWNTKPIAGWPSGEQRELWGAIDRGGFFIDALEKAREAGRKLDLDDVKSLMRTAAVSDIFAARLVPFFEDAVSGLDAGSPLVDAVGRMRAWVDAGASLVAVPDHDGVIPDPGAAIYTEVRTVAQKAVFADELGDAFRAMSYPAVNAGDDEDDHGSFGSPDALFLRVLFSAGAVAGANPPVGLLPVSRNYFDDVDGGTHATRTEVLRDALQTALDNLRERFGTDDPARWQMPALRESYRDLGALSTVFGATTMERENRGSFNLAVELGSPVHGEIVVPPGQSGSFTTADVGHEPAHLRDQLRLYEDFAYRVQPFELSELAGPLTSETIPVMLTFESAGSPSRSRRLPALTRRAPDR